MKKIGKLSRVVVKVTHTELQVEYMTEKGKHEETLLVGEVGQIPKFEAVKGSICEISENFVLG